MTKYHYSIVGVTPETAELPAVVAQSVKGCINDLFVLNDTPDREKEEISTYTYGLSENALCIELLQTSSVAANRSFTSALGRVYAKSVVVVQKRHNTSG